MYQKYFVGLVLMATVLVSGCVIQPVGGASDAAMDPAGEVDQGISSSGSGGAYKLKPLDPIYLRFSGIMEQQQLEVVIDENGEISLLHIEKSIQAAGLTTSALEHEIERLYREGDIYKHVSVNVTMTAKIFYVQGEVLAPGQFPLMSGTTLLQAIAGARGPSAFANLKKVTITRYGKVYSYNIKKLEKNPSLDVKIEAGDVIKVWQHWY